MAERCSVAEVSLQVQAGQTLAERDEVVLVAPCLDEAHRLWAEVKGTMQQAAIGHEAQQLADPNWEPALEPEAQPPSVVAGASELCPHPHPHPQPGRHQISHG